MRRLLPFIAATVTVLAVPTAADAQQGCPIGQYLVEGRRGSEDVRCLQAALNSAGVDSGPVDGWYGPITRGAVIRYQQANGLTVDGEVGAQTAGRLGLWQPEARTGPSAARTATNRTTPPSGGGGGVWDRLAQCESGGDWAINTGNGYYGGLQFLASTWRANGGTGLPHQHSRAEQIRVAENLRASSGFAPWPACSRKLGLR